MGAWRAKISSFAIEVILLMIYLSKACNAQLAPLQCDTLFFVALPINECIKEWEDHISRKFRPFRHGAWHDGRGGRGKRQLEQEHGEDVAHFLTTSVDEETTQPDEGITARACPETETKAKGPVCDTTEHHVKGVLHHDVHLRLWWHTPGFQ